MLVMFFVNSLGEAIKHIKTVFQSLKTSSVQAGSEDFELQRLLPPVQTLALRDSFDVSSSGFCWAFTH